MNTQASLISKKILFVTSIASVLICAILRTVSTVFFYDTARGYFGADAILPILSSVALIISVIFIAVLSFLAFRKSKITVSPPSRSVASLATSIIAAISLIFLGINDIIFSADFLLLVLDIAAAIFFIVCTLSINSFVKVGGGLLFIIRIALMIYNTHFDWSTPTNAPEKLLLLIACGFTVIFISQELKSITGTAKPALYIFSAATTATVGVSASLSVLVSYFCNVMNDTNGIYGEYYVILAISIYAAVRALNLFKELKSSTSDSDND